MDVLILKLGLALAIGLLVGLERGWRERAAPSGSRTAGIRTYGLAGLLGGVLAAVADALHSPYLFAAGFLGFAAIFAAFKYREAAHDRDFSVTAVVAGLCVFGLGGLAVAGDYRVAAAGGASLAAVLASREMLHGLLKRISWIELRSALVLAVMTAVILPLLPDRTIDPWGGLDPREIWSFTVLTAAISYLGYIATRVIGPGKGLLVSGLAGALVSSTAVTVAFARAARTEPNTRALAGAAALAAMVSILRVVAVVSIVRPGVLAGVLPSTLAASAVFAACGGILLRRSAGRDDAAEHAGPVQRNPFELGALLLFAALLAAVSTASAAAARAFGGDSVIATSALSGTFDVDVAVLSALRLTGPDVPAAAIGEAVLAALGANALGRLALAVSAGPSSYWLPLAGATALAGAAGIAAFVLAA